VSSVGDVSSIKSKTVCTFYCLNFHPSLFGLLCACDFLWFFYLKFAQNPPACRRTLIALDNPSNYFCSYNYSSIWQLFHVAPFIDKKICLSSDTLVEGGMPICLAIISWSTATNGLKRVKGKR